MMKKGTNKKVILLAILILTLVTTGVGLSIFIDKLTAEAARSKDFEVFNEALTIVRRNYVEEIPSKDLIRSALQGVVESLESCADSGAQVQTSNICKEAKEVFVKKLSGTTAFQADSPEELKVFKDTFATVRETYEEQHQQKHLIYSAIKGMIESLDAHSEFMTPEQHQEMQVDAKGEFGGIGIKLTMQEGMLTVVGILNGTPAYRSGIREGDRIIKIDYDDTENMSVPDAITRMRGNPATPVRLTILRGRPQQLKDFTLIREMITINSVASRMLGEGVGYVKINQFQKQTASELSGALSELHQKHMRALILDLRDNPGGLVFSAVDVAGHFIPPGKTVVYTMNKKGEKKEYRSKEKDPYSSIPIAIVVNKKSASAAEIVAGALKDWGRATLIGTRTYGKGSVQTLVPLKDGSAIKITTAKYFTPKGISIQTTGITPDIVVTPGLKAGQQTYLTEKDDAQLQGALKVLQSSHGHARSCPAMSNELLELS